MPNGLISAHQELDAARSPLPPRAVSASVGVDEADAHHFRSKTASRSVQSAPNDVELCAAVQCTRLHAIRQPPHESDAPFFMNDKSPRPASGSFWFLLSNAYAERGAEAQRSTTRTTRHNTSAAPTSTPPARSATISAESCWPPAAAEKKSMSRDQGARLLHGALAGRVDGWIGGAGAQQTLQPV